MKKSTCIATAALALISFNQYASAQQPSPPTDAYQHPMMPMDHPMMRDSGMPHPMRQPGLQHPEMPPRFMPEFPSAQELARMAPPEPMTEEKIKQRFARQKADLQASIERDRKAAEKYASDFARLQKYQADRLAEMMARAEERREQMMQRLQQREDQVLQQFREQQAPAKPATKEEQT